MGAMASQNHQPHHCILNRLFRRRSKKTSKLRAIGFCAENSPVTGEIPVQMASNAEHVSIWWRHHDSSVCIHIRQCKPIYAFVIISQNRDAKILLSYFVKRPFIPHSLWQECLLTRWHSPSHGIEQVHPGYFGINLFENDRRLVSIAMFLTTLTHREFIQKMHHGVFCRDLFTITQY